MRRMLPSGSVTVSISSLRVWPLAPVVVEVACLNATCCSFSSAAVLARSGVVRTMLDFVPSGSAGTISTIWPDVPGRLSSIGLLFDAVNPSLVR